jgi:sugar phosphate isomerase/epimerase
MCLDGVPVMKISCGTWAFSFGPYSDHPIGIEESAKRLSAAGYDGVEICGFPPQVTLERYAAKESRRELVRLLTDLNLGVSGYSADHTSVNLAAPGNQERYLDLFRRNVELCADIGSPLIRVDTVSAPGSLSEREYGESFERIADIWRRAAEIAAGAGVLVAWEFEPGFILNKPSEIVALHDRIGHPNFKVILDTSHAYLCSVVGARQQPPKETLAGGVAQLLKKLNGRIGHVHLVDTDGTLYGDETSTHLPFGEGVVDFKALAPLLAAQPGIGWWCVDLCFCEGAWDLVESSLAFVKGLLA